MTDGQSLHRATPSSLELLAANERAIAALYEEYARQHRDNDAFWLELASAEYRHATWIEALSTRETSEDTKGSRFRRESIQSFIRYVKDQEEVARRNGIAFATALSLAYFIETALIERRFFEQLEPQGSNAQRLMSNLQRETEQHVNRVKDELSRAKGV